MRGSFARISNRVSVCLRDVMALWEAASEIFHCI